MQSTIILAKGIPRAAILAMIGIMLCVGGCGKDKKPKLVLSEAELSSFLVEIYVAEAKLGSSKIVKDSAIKVFKPYEKMLMDKHKISTQSLKETYRYYLDHPIEFEKIYEITMDTLSLQEKRAEQAGKIKK